MSIAIFVMFLCALIFSLLFQTTESLSEALLGTSRDVVDFCLKTGGAICFFCGLMKIMQKSGLCDILAKLLRPALRKIIPDCAKSKQAETYSSMNIVSNILGLGNAATPYGIAATKCLFKQKKNAVPTRSVAAFVVLNTASVQLLPTTIAVMRQAHGAAQPFDILPCIIITQLCACAVGLIAVRIVFGRDKGTE